MDPERRELESSSTDTSLEVPVQLCRSNWEMERTTVDDCSLVDRSSGLGETIFPPEELVIGTQPDNQTSASFASSKIIFLQMSCKLQDTKELANREKSSSTVVNWRGVPTALKIGCTGIPLGGGGLWTWMPGLFLLLLSVRFLFVCFFAAGRSDDDDVSVT